MTASQRAIIHGLVDRAIDNIEITAVTTYPNRRVFTLNGEKHIYTPIPPAPADDPHDSVLSWWPVYSKSKREKS